MRLDATEQLPLASELHLAQCLWGSSYTVVSFNFWIVFLDEYFTVHQSIAARCLDCFPCEAFGLLLWLFVYLSLCGHLFIDPGEIFRSATFGLTGKFMFSFWKKFLDTSKVSAQFYVPTSDGGRFQFLHSLAHTCCYPCFWWWAF